ncbi:MAG: hypothetical protein MJ072_00455 [Clostridia bacterium]|nr:hypothetical protein [Clostridia bacterium]
MKNNDVIAYENGDEYFGECENGVREGDGVYVSGEVKIYGVWHNNSLDGEGKMVTPDFVYEGGFVNSKRQGFGVERHADKTYEGEFKQGKKDGKMKITLKNGCVIDCVYKDGYGVGEGIMTMTDGEKVKVRFDGGKMWFI